MNPTFDKIITACICLISLMGLIFIYNLPTQPEKGMIIGILATSFGGSGAYFYRSSSSSANKDAANKETTEKLTDALANSTPVANQNNI